ncbi:hypothetical protein D7X74_04300 [Corallococcus sp. CA047B]|nr:hypothetical protein D7X74_04300 [Corallococcus sp. CA047B]
MAGLIRDALARHLEGKRAEGPASGGAELGPRTGSIVAHTSSAPTHRVVPGQGAAARRRLGPGLLGTRLTRARPEAQATHHVSRVGVSDVSRLRGAATALSQKALLHWERRVSVDFPASCRSWKCHPRGNPCR